MQQSTLTVSLVILTNTSHYGILSSNFYRMILLSSEFFSFFFFNDTATTEIYTLSLHDALPISVFEAEAHLDHFFFARGQCAQDLSSLVLEVHIDHGFGRRDYGAVFDEVAQMRDRKSTRLNSSHT